MTPRKCLAPFLAALALGGSVSAQQQDAVKPVPRVTGEDPAALAKRMKMLEERVDNMWSVRQGPDIMALDTVDRLATRLLAVEARLASLEKGGAGGTQALAVATSLAVLADADPERIVASHLDAKAAGLQRLRYLVVLSKLTPWPTELSPKARAMVDALHLALKAVSRGEQGAAERLARDANVARRQLMAAGMGWTSRASAPNPSHGHMDHSSRHGGQLGMRGDLHIEAVLRGSGADWTYDVHLSDATRTPIWPDTVKGDIVLWPDDDRQVIIPLSPVGEKLSGKAGIGPGPGSGKEPVDLRVRLDGTSQGRVEMDFSVPPLAQ